MSEARQSPCSFRSNSIEINSIEFNQIDLPEVGAVLCRGTLKLSVGHFLERYPEIQYIHDKRYIISESPDKEGSLQNTWRGLGFPLVR